MSAEEKRSVTIKINDQEVVASVRLVEREMAKARLELKKAAIGSDEYNKAMKRMDELRPILDKHRQDLKGVAAEAKTAAKESQEVVKATKGGGQMGGMLSAFRSGATSALGGSGGLGALGSLVGAAGPIGLATAAVTGLVSAVSSGFTTIKEFNVGMSDLRAITGLSAEDMGFFKDQAIEFATRFGEAPKAILEAFKLAGSARPELLANKESLAAFTEQALILAKASREEVGTTISSLTTIMNAYGASSDDAARYVNVLAAGSQAGAKEVGFLSAAMEKIGPTAANAGLSIEQTTAILETLGEKGINSAETAGTNLRNVLLELQNDTANYKNGVFDMETALQRWSGSATDAVALQKAFGKENAVAAGIIFQNKERIDQLTEAVTNTNTATEQAAIQQNNLDGELAKIGARWDSFWLSLSDGEGILTWYVGAWNDFLDVAEDAYDSLKAAIIDLATSEEEAKYKKMLEDTARMKKEAEGNAEAWAKAAIESGTAAEKLQVLDKQVQTLAKGSVGYAAAEARANVLRTLMGQQAEKEAAAEEMRKKKLEDQRQEAEKKKREDQQAERERLRELKELEEKKVAASQKATQEGNAAAGIGPIKSKDAPLLQPTIDLEKQKTELFKKAVDERKAYDKLQADQLASEKEIKFRQELDRYADLAGQTTDIISQLVAVGINNRVNRETKALDAMRKRGELSDVEYAKRKEQIERKAFEDKQRLDIATALMNAAVAATKVYAQTGAFGAAAMAPIYIQLAGQIALIKAQKFETGGMVRGKRHSQGGVMIEAEDGEFVVRRNAVNWMTLPLLRRINEGQMPLPNYSMATSRLRMEQGGMVNAGGGTDKMPDLTVVMNAMVSEVRALRQDINSLEARREVKFVEQDYEKFKNRLDRIQTIAAA